jgi:Tol biopolymer transport system component
VVLSTATMPQGSSNLRLPSFSPDGTTITFAYDEGNVGAVGLVNADASQFRKLAGGSTLAYGAPSFSNDGLSVVAAAGSAGLALTQLERLSVSTGMPTSITNDLTAAGATDVANRVLVSPDGTKAVFDGHVSTGSTRIFVIDLLTKAVVKVNDYTNEPGTNDTFPCWVGAAKVAFSSDSGGNDNVYSVNADPSLGAALQLMVPKAIEATYGPR